MASVSNDKKKSQSDTFLLVIACFKLAKALLFICAGVGLLHLLGKDIEGRLEHLMDVLHVDSDNDVAKWCLDEAGKLTSIKLASLSAIGFFYAALFGTEGIGLYLQKRWAEYFVIIVTGSLLPLEFYEFFHRITVVKVLLTIGNLMILGYLIHIVRRKRQD